MGRVRPSKDKKDATTMPPSKEMKKTQKVNKGPSALELVKKKYKGQIMDMKTEEAKSLFSHHLSGILFLIHELFLFLIDNRFS